MTLAVECVSKGFPGSARRSDKTRRSGGEVTLEELIVGVWEDLAAYKETLCPVCGGRMVASGTGTYVLKEVGDDAPPGSESGSLSASCLSCGSLLN